MQRLKNTKASTKNQTLVGRFITLEGTEGAGKSTVLKFIQTYLQQRGKQILITREPGGTKIGEHIRQLLLHVDEPMEAATELLLMFADRAQHIAQCILPALRKGLWVVSDRYIDASYAYQGGGRGISSLQLEMLDKFVVGGLYPDLTFLLDIPIDIGFLRSKQRGNQKDRIEQEQLSFFERVRQVYLDRAKQEQQRIYLINASLTLEKVEQQISESLETFLLRENVS